MIAVAGASGGLGRRVALRLLEERRPVRALSRDPESRLGFLAGKGAETASWDLTDSASLSRALKGVEMVVAAAHGFFPPVRGNDVRRVDSRGNRRLVDAAGKVGVRHFLLVSNTVPRGCAFGRAKQEAEDHLAASGLPYTILRPATYAETHALALLAQPLGAGRPVRFLGPGTTPLRWISVADVARDVTGILDREPLEGIRTIGGADVLSRLEALKVVESVLGREAKRRHLPLPVLRLARLLFRPFHRPLSDFLEVAEWEATQPEDPGWSLPAVDWEGPTRLERVVRRWWAEEGREG